MEYQIEMEEIIVDEVTIPRNDGTRGSALYKVPFKLSEAPDSVWADLFIEAWNYPKEYTPRHRPGIARVVGNKILLDGTTIDEINEVHVKTLKYAVETANKGATEYYYENKKRLEEEKRRKTKMDENHKKHVRNVSESIDLN